MSRQVVDPTFQARIMYISQGSRKPEFFLRRHAHPNLWQADWVRSGEVIFVMNDSQVLVGADEIVVIPPDTTHGLLSAPGFTFQSIRFELSHSVLDGRVEIIRIDEQKPLLRLLALELFTLRVSLPWKMTTAYLGALLRLLSPRMPLDPSQGEMNYGGLDPISCTQQYALAHLNYNLTVKELADIVHFSSPHFARLFKSVTGQSPICWIAEQRLLRARELLRYADCTITDIAIDVGYADLPTFSKAFRRWQGLSPLDFRHQCRQVGRRLPGGVSCESGSV